MKTKYRYPSLPATQLTPVLLRRIFHWHFSHSSVTHQQIHTLASPIKHKQQKKEHSRLLTPIWHQLTTFIFLSSRNMNSNRNQIHHLGTHWNIPPYYLLPQQENEWMNEISTFFPLFVCPYNEWLTDSWCLYSARLSSSSFLSWFVRVPPFSFSFFPVSSWGLSGT